VNFVPINISAVTDHHQSDCIRVLIVHVEQLSCASPAHRSPKFQPANTITEEELTAYLFRYAQV
jgi:hypothetical protein